MIFSLNLIKIGIGLSCLPHSLQLPNITIMEIPKHRLILTQRVFQPHSMQQTQPEYSLKYVVRVILATYTIKIALSVQSVG